MYRSYYPHRSRDSLSPVCGIFLNMASPIILCPENKDHKLKAGLQVEARKSLQCKENMSDRRRCQGNPFPSVIVTRKKPLIEKNQSHK